MLQHVMSITLVAALASASPAPSQIRANSAIYTGQAKPVSGLMVANPVLTASGDSSVSVTVADGMRDRLTRTVGSTYNVVTKRNMNVALATFGFAENELLNAASAIRLAGQIGGTKLIVTSTLSKAADGRYSITARLANVGASLDAGHVVTVAQVAGQPLSDFGSAVGDAILPAVKGWADGLNCVNTSSTKPDKAAEAAAKAYKVLPGHGLAAFCLAEMAKKRDSVGPATLQAWQDVVKGDALSLTAWSQIGLIYQITKDSAKVVETYQQMLRIAPTNQVLRDESYKIFTGYGRPDAAMKVVEEGIKLDPANTDWYDLKSNVCIGQGDLNCAIASLEEIYVIDSTRADTNFYAKILYAAKTKPDTAKYLMWAKRGATKFETRPDVLEELAIAYGWVGESDSAVVTAKKMIMLDESRTDAFMRVVQSLVDGKKYREAAALAPTVKGLSDQTAKNTYGALLLPGAQALQQATPTDNAALIEVSEAILSVGVDNQNLIIFSNFFLSVGLRQSVIDMSTAVRAPSATCEMVRNYDAVLTKIEPALVSAATSTTEGVANFAKGLLPSVQAEKPYVASRITALCR